MIRDQLLAALRQSPPGLSLAALAEQIDKGVHPETVAAMEAILQLSPEVTRADGRWVLVSEGRTMRILSAIEAYALASGRKIFRVSSALAALPPADHPTEAELKAAIGSSGGRYELMPNGMMKRIH